MLFSMQPNAIGKSPKESGFLDDALRWSSHCWQCQLLQERMGQPCRPPQLEYFTTSFVTDILEQPGFLAEPEVVEMRDCPTRALAVLGWRWKRSRTVSGDGTLFGGGPPLLSSRELWKLVQRNQFTNALKTAFPPKGIVIIQHLSPAPSLLLHLSHASTSISMSV